MCEKHIIDYLDNKYTHWKDKIIWNHHTEGRIELNYKPDLLSISNEILN
jgi:hypothetical protein